MSKHERALFELWHNEAVELLILRGQTEQASSLEAAKEDRWALWKSIRAVAAIEDTAVKVGPNGLPETFEQHFELEYAGGVHAFERLGDSARVVIFHARRAWDAAVESMKPRASVHQYKGWDVGESVRWTLSVEACNKHFATPGEAIAWGLKRGYHIRNGNEFDVAA